MDATESVNNLIIPILIKPFAKIVAAVDKTTTDVKPSLHPFLWKIHQHL